MSDSESHISAQSVTTSRDNLGIEEDEGLDDHRHQPSSLPLRSAPSSSSTIPQHSSSPAAHQQQAGDINDELPRKSNRAFMTSLRTDYYNTADVDDDVRNSIPLNRGTGSSFAAAERRGTQPQPPPQGSILLNSMHHSGSSSNPAANVGGSGSGVSKTRMRRTSITGIEMKRKNSIINSNLESDIVSPMTKMRTNDSNCSERTGGGYRRERRTSRSSIDSDQDSRASRSSQETEEDVCFPMSREHVRINGIDFDEIEEFIKAEREEEDYMKAQQILIAERTASRINNRSSIRSGLERTKSSTSSAAMKYTPKNILRRTATKLENLTTNNNKLEQSNDRINHTTIPANLESSTSTEEDEKNAYTTFAADNIYHNDDYIENSYEGVKFGGTRTNDPTTSLPERFSFFLSESDETVHAADIPSLVEEGQTVRELFRNGEGTWWLDCVCPTDAEMKMIAKAFGIHPLTAEDIRMQETREKVELFRSYYFVCFHTFEPDKESEDYLEPINVYIVVFKEGILSFHFSPLQHPGNVRRRVRQLRDYVDVSADWLCYALIDDITDEFAPVITAIEYEADAIEDAVFVTRELDFSSMLQRIGEARRKVMTLMRLLSGKADVIKMFAKRCQDEALHNNPINTNQSFANLAGVSQQATFNSNSQSAGQGVAQPRADIALYLGDIQDHILTMFQNLNAYEKIFSRSHANYLAQLQVESFNSNNKVTGMLSKVTLIGTALVPLNLITGLFGTFMSPVWVVKLYNGSSELLGL